MLVTASLVWRANICAGGTGMVQSRELKAEAGGQAEDNFFYLFSLAG